VFKNGWGDVCVFKGCDIKISVSDFKTSVSDFKISVSDSVIFVSGFEVFVSDSVPSGGSAVSIGLVIFILKLAIWKVGVGGKTPVKRLGEVEGETPAKGSWKVGIGVGVGCKTLVKGSKDD
jgi:hypothetical protein